MSAVEMIPMGKRPSWPARQALMSMAWTATDARHTRDPELAAAGEWFMARARREFRAALWADEARATGLVERQPREQACGCLRCQSPTWNLDAICDRCKR